MILIQRTQVLCRFRGVSILCCYEIQSRIYHKYLIPQTMNQQMSAYYQSLLINYYLFNLGLNSTRQINCSLNCGSFRLAFSRKIKCVNDVFQNAEFITPSFDEFCIAGNDKLQCQTIVMRLELQIFRSAMGLRDKPHSRIEAIWFCQEIYKEPNILGLVIYIFGVSPNFEIIVAIRHWFNIGI